MAYQFDKSGKLKAPTAAELAAADADPNSYIIVLDQGTMRNGNPYWVYLAVKPSKYKEFIQATKARKSITHKNFGTVLKYGFDKQVPLAAQEEMKQKHGFDENYLQKLAKDLKAAKTQFDKQQEDKKIGDIVAMLKMKQSGN
jgi:hypothetical protein